MTDDVAAARLAEIRQHANAQQREALGDDGVVTVDEYRTAVDDTLTCIDGRLVAAARRYGVELDVTPDDVGLTPDGFMYDYKLSFDLGDGAAKLPPDALQQLDSIELDCQRTNLTAVAQAFQVMKRTDAAYLERVRDGVDACVTKRGYDGPVDGVATSDLIAALGSRDSASEAAFRCFDGVPSLTIDLSADGIAHAWG
jgi:hypothetical protein